VTHVLVLTAVDLEARGLARHLGLAPVGGARWPHYRGGALEIAGIGVRGTCLEERVAGGPPPSLVVSAGACGALAPDLAAGDLVVPETVMAPTGARHATDPWPGLLRAGALLTVAELVETPAAKARLWVATGALAVDMESATILAWARARGVPVVVVRGVADTAQQTVPADLAALVEPGGGVRAGRALRVALGRPRAVADAVTLGRGTAAALKTVAAALGRIARS
jgi:adenosylhomocysteine nucleosidase